MNIKLPQVQLLLAQERFIARSAANGYSKNFIIKGGTAILRLYDLSHTRRFTVDNDLSIYVYPPHFIFAEKFETAYTFGTGNTRAKDYIDMWTLIKSDLDKEASLISIQKCFDRRKTFLKKEEWLRIISDVYLREIVGIQIKKNYKDLKLPSVDIMFEVINKFVLPMTEQICLN